MLEYEPMIAAIESSVLSEPATVVASAAVGASLIL